MSSLRDTALGTAGGRLKHNRNQLAGEELVGRTSSQQNRAQGKKKIKISIERFRYDWNVHKNTKGVTHFPEPDTAGPAAFSSKMFHGLDFCRRREELRLESHSGSELG